MDGCMDEWMLGFLDDKLLSAVLDGLSNGLLDGWLDFGGWMDAKVGSYWPSRVSLPHNIGILPAVPMIGLECMST